MVRLALALSVLEIVFKEKPTGVYGGRPDLKDVRYGQDTIPGERLHWHFPVFSQGCDKESRESNPNNSQTGPELGMLSRSWQSSRNIVPPKPAGDMSCCHGPAWCGVEVNLSALGEELSPPAHTL